MQSVSGRSATGDYRNFVNRIGIRQRRAAGRRARRSLAAICRAAAADARAMLLRRAGRRQGGDQLLHVRRNGRVRLGWRALAVPAAAFCALVMAAAVVIVVIADEHDRIALRLIDARRMLSLKSINDD